MAWATSRPYRRPAPGDLRQSSNSREAQRKQYNSSSTGSPAVTYSRHRSAPSRQARRHSRQVSVSARVVLVGSGWSVKIASEKRSLGRGRRNIRGRVREQACTTSFAKSRRCGFCGNRGKPFKLMSAGRSSVAVAPSRSPFRWSGVGARGWLAAPRLFSGGTARRQPGRAEACPRL